MTQVQCICLVCQKPFLVKPFHHAKGRGLYCSKPCHYAAHRVELVCTKCGKGFVRLAHQVKPQPFCSRACSNSFRGRPLAERFWEKVIKDGPVIRAELGQCWEWDGSKLPQGYGQLGKVRPAQGYTLAHRVSWELHFGPIPESLKVLHRCDYPPCTRPEHLFVGTQSLNMQDAIQKGRNAAMKLTPEQVREIRQALQPPSQTVRGIADLYHVSIQAIYDIRSGRRWAGTI